MDRAGAFGSVANVSTNGVSAGKYDNSVVTGFCFGLELELPQPTSTAVATIPARIVVISFRPIGRRVPLLVGDCSQNVDLRRAARGRDRRQHARDRREDEEQDQPRPIGSVNTNPWSASGREMIQREREPEHDPEDRPDRRR